jgi:exopolyphosphatase/guanosine-5'-triphosphate,3'-diphosphate pyrophosphatase
MDRWASIKIGGTSVNLLVVETSEKDLTPLVHERRIVKLASGVCQTGSLTPEAMERCFAVLSEYAQILEAVGVGRLWVVGTSALRQAKNADAFVADVARHFGWHVVCLSGEIEARVGYLGAVGNLNASDMLVVDVGGGSTEVVMGHQCQPLWVKSLNVGAISLTEAFLSHDPIQLSEYTAMSRYIEDVLTADLDLERLGELTVVGVGGSIAAVALLDLGLDGFDESRVHGHRLAVESLRRIQDKFLSKTSVGRAELLAAEKERAGVIVAGVAIFLALADLLAVREIVVSAYGVDLGIIRAGKEAPSSREWI